jgi:hypothetical protein
LLSDHWWFWLLLATVVICAAISTPRYRAFVAVARRYALRRGLVQLPPGHTLENTARRNLPGELSWLSILVGLWVVLGPWIWGYQDASGAIATDVVTGALVIAFTVGAIVFPALSALNVLAGLWLMLAPWLVGYGDTDGPVGLSDSLAGLVICAVAIGSLAAAERAVGPGQRAIGRIRVRD